MRKPSVLLLAAFGLTVLAASAAAFDIPFIWLEKPAGRTNKNDPNSPFFVNPGTFTPTPLTGPSSPTATRTATSVINTATLTQTPNPAFSSTNTPVNTATSTNVPPTSTATPTFAPGVHGSKVADGEGGLVSEWPQTPGSIYISKDSVSTAAPDPPVPASAGNNVPGGTSANSFCYSGSIGDTSNSPYPYSVIVFELVAGWLRTTPGVDLTSYAPANSLTFSLKSNVAGRAFKIDMPSSGVVDPNYNYFEYQFTPADTNWHQYTVYFPDGAGTPKFAQAYPPYVTWATEKTSVGQIRIQPITNTAGPNSYDYCVDDITFATPPTPTATVTRTATPNYSPTYTPTPLAGFSGLWYDGETAGALLADVTPVANGGASDSYGITEMSDGGASGANYIRLTATAAALSYFVGGQIGRDPQNLGAPFTKLTVSFRVNGASCPMAAVQLISDNPLTYSAQSVSVPLGKYIPTQVPVASGTWYTSVIPISEFLGTNSAGGNFSAAELASIIGVQIRPESRSFNGGALSNATLDIDSVGFGGGSAPIIRPQPQIFGDFESPTSSGASASNWGTYFYVFSDREPSPVWPATDCTSNGGTVTSWTFPGAGGNPVDAGGAAVTSCQAMHISGNKGGNGAGGPGSCNSNYSYIGSGMSFGTATETVNPTSCMTTACSWEAPRTSPMAVDMKAAMGLSGDVQGIRFKAKKGPNHQAGQSYLLVIENDTRACGGSDFQHRISDSQLTSSYQNFDIPFPAVGTLGKSGGDAAIDSTFGQPSWAGCEISWTNLFRAMSVSVEGNNLTFDIYIDDVEFY